MAEAKTSSATGKATAAGTWNTAKKVTAGDDVTLASPFNVEWNTAEQVRSFVGASGATWSGTLEVKIGAATAGPSNVAFSLSSGTTVSANAAVRFLGSASATQTIATGGHKLPTKVSIDNSGKYQLLEALAVTEALVVEESASLETSAHAVETKYMQLLGTATLAASGSTFTITASSIGEGWHAEGTTTLSGAPSVLFTDTTQNIEHQFGGGGKTYGTVTFVAWTKVENSNTFAAVAANPKAKPPECKATFTEGLKAFITTEEGNLFAGVEPAGKGISAGTTLVKKVKVGEWEMSNPATETIGVAEAVLLYPPGVVFVAGTKQNVTTLTSNGTSGEPARMASTVAGTAATIELGGEAESTAVVRVRDITVTNGPWYLPNGVNLGGTSGIVFAKKGGTSFSRESSEALSCAEAASRTSGFPRSSAEALALVDVVSRAGGAPRGVTELVVAAETAGVARAGVRVASEGLGVAEVAGRLEGSVRVGSEGLGFGETGSGHGGFPRGVAEVLGLAEAGGAVHGTSRSAADAAGIGEAGSRVAGGSRGVFDGLALSEVGSRAGSGLRQASEGLQLAEAVSFTRGSSRVTSEPLSFGEALGRSAGSARTAVDGVRVSDMAGRASGAVRLVVDLLLLGEVVTVETGSLTQHPARIVLRSRKAADLVLRHRPGGGLVLVHRKAARIEVEG